MYNALLLYLDLSESELLWDLSDTDGNLSTLLDLDFSESLNDIDLLSVSDGDLDTDLSTFFVLNFSDFDLSEPFIVLGFPIDSVGDLDLDLSSLICFVLDLSRLDMDSETLYPGSFIFGVVCFGDFFEPSNSCSEAWFGEILPIELFDSLFSNLLRMSLTLAISFVEGQISSSLA